MLSGVRGWQVWLQCPNMQYTNVTSRGHAELTESGPALTAHPREARRGYIPTSAPGRVPSPKDTGGPLRAFGWGSKGLGLADSVPLCL